MIGIIGVDIGTTGTKTAVYDTEGHLLGESFEESRLFYPAPGCVEQWPEDFYTSACHTIAGAMQAIRKEKPKIAAIAIDGQMAGILGIDMEFKPTTHYDSWLDTRCWKQVQYIQETAELEVIASAGLPTITAHCGKILWWKENHPDIFEKTEKFVMPAGFVAGKLCGLNGKEAFMDETYCHFTGLYDFRSHRWNERLCSRFGIDTEKFPSLKKPWEIVGNLTRQAAKDCGLDTDVLVVAGCGDQAAGFLGAGIVEPGMLVDVAGTASVFGCAVSEFIPDMGHKTLMSSKAVSDNLWVPHAFLPGGGMCLRWFRDDILHGADMSYEQLNKQAERLPEGPTGILFQPYLGGCSFPFDNRLRGNFAGISWDTDYRVIYRALMEGIAYEYRRYLEIEKEIFQKNRFRQVITYGGGAKSRLFNQIKADVLGIPYVRIEREEVGTLGSAIVAGYGVGIFDNLENTAKKLTRQKEVTEPKEQNHRRYEEYAELYKEYLNRNRKLDHALYQLKMEERKWSRQ